MGGIVRGNPRRENCGENEDEDEHDSDGRKRIVAGDAGERDGEGRHFLVLATTTGFTYIESTTEEQYCGRALFTEEVLTPVYYPPLVLWNHEFRVSLPAKIQSANDLLSKYSEIRS